MDPSLQPLLRRLEQLAEPFPELHDGVQKAISIAELAPEMALTQTRKVLEHVIHNVYLTRKNEPPGTRPLENLVQTLVKDGFFPKKLDAYAEVIRKLGNVGTHTFGETITVTDVHQSLSQLTYILDWYVAQERPAALAGQPAPGPPATPVRPAEPAAAPGTAAAVVPKGLRSFDANDADFFLDLLPGTRHRDGLPESIRFWKHRIEQRDEPSFTVGVIYGPSGCGKSSLVKAGLLPRLAGRILPVYVEATANDTEARLLKGLRKRCPDLPGDLDLTRTMAALRQGEGLTEGRKVFLVLDQFEQWLHARRGEDDTELAQALRQCDGEHVQCVVLVRDDFWLAVSRFMTALHIELVQGQNLALVDLFDPLHARAVLAAFGRAFGRLPAEPSREQESFLDRAVAELSQDGRVISVRLALFAEMVKGKPWTPATLKAVGGTEGVGVAFLEETFGSRTANPRHRAHEQAARAVLKALLPEQGSDIKGNMRSHGQLLEASGYGRRPQDFEDLLRILDSEVRLITPTEPAGAGAGAAGQYYQLTHDYLVHSLREWLTRKQRETRRGRAELRLAERASSWSARPENRHLPAWWEWLNIRLLTRKTDWTPSQRKMMRQADGHYATLGGCLAALLAVLLLWQPMLVGLWAVRLGALALCLAPLAWLTWVSYGRIKAQGLRDRLMDANTTDVRRVIQDMARYRRWTDPLLREAYKDAKTNNAARKQLHAGLALLPVDRSQVEYVSGRLLDAEPQEVAVIRDALLPYRELLLARLWAVVEQPDKGREGQRLRAACALATYDPDDPRWDRAAGPVAEQLVSVNPVFLAPWMEGLRPVRARLLAPLATVFRERDEQRTAERNLATSILADYAADQPALLAQLVQDADERQFPVLCPQLDRHQGRVAAVMNETIGTPPASMTTDEEKEALAKRQANAAVVLLRTGQADKVWPVLRHGPDPRARSYLIHRLSPLGADPRALIKRLGEEPDVSVRRALLLALGEYGAKGLTAGDSDALLSRVFGLYRDDPDAGLHAAAEWLLLQWGQQARLKGAEDGWREARSERIGPAGVNDKAAAQWYVNGQGQTMVVIPGPLTFLMGSPPTEAGREGGPEGEVERPHDKRIGRSFTIAARTVTVEQFRRFRKDHDYNRDYSPTGECPVNVVTWYDAAAYCNWLCEQELIDKDQWCYLPNDDGEYAEGMRLAPDYLHRSGYRLPSEAEWEYACRAGALTSRYYGETEELLGKYAWYTKNSLDRGMLPGVPGRFGVPGDRLKPNDFGLFDMLGNALEWCQESIAYYTPGEEGKAAEDIEDKKDIKDKLSRVLRGGSFDYQAVYVRCANRLRIVPSNRFYYVGFRPARTYR